MNCYGLEIRNTIGANIFVGSIKKIGQFTENLHKVSVGTARGYVNEGKISVFQYNGRYGEGYAICKPNIFRRERATNLFTVEYWVR